MLHNEQNQLKNVAARYISLLKLLSNYPIPQHLKEVEKIISPNRGRLFELFGQGPHPEIIKFEEDTLSINPIYSAEVKSLLPFAKNEQQLMKLYINLKKRKNQSQGINPLTTEATLALMQKEIWLKTNGPLVLQNSKYLKIDLLFYLCFKKYSEAHQKVEQSQSIPLTVTELVVEFIKLFYPDNNLKKIDDLKEILESNEFLKINTICTKIIKDVTRDITQLNLNDPKHLFPVLDIQYEFAKYYSIKFPEFFYSEKNDEVNFDFGKILAAQQLFNADVSSKIKLHRHWHFIFQSCIVMLHELNCKDTLQHIELISTEQKKENTLLSNSLFSSANSRKRKSLDLDDYPGLKRLRTHLNSYEHEFKKAVMQKKFEVAFGYLMKSEFDLHHTEQPLFFPLIQARAWLSEEDKNSLRFLDSMFTRLMNLNVDINKPGPCLRTPLHYTVQNRCNNWVSWLIAKGAYVNVQDKYGNTPLHEASVDGNIECVKILLQANASLDIENNQGQIPLDYAKHHHEIVCKQTFEPELESLLVSSHRISLQK